MCMKVCLCMGVCVSLGDGGSVGSQGKRAAAMAWGRPRWSSAVVLLGDGMIITKRI
jgi:hypothetical protein